MKYGKIKIKKLIVFSSIICAISVFVIFFYSHLARGSKICPCGDEPEDCTCTLTESYCNTNNGQSCGGTTCGEYCKRDSQPCSCKSPVICGGMQICNCCAGAQALGCEVSVCPPYAPSTCGGQKSCGGELSNCTCVFPGCRCKKHCKNATNPTAKQPCLFVSSCCCCAYGCPCSPCNCIDCLNPECGFICFCNCRDSLPNCKCLKQPGKCKSGIHDWPRGHCEFCHDGGPYCGGNPVKPCPRP